MPSDENRQKRVLRLEREFTHSRAELWDAWTNPELLLLWFGPEHAPARGISADVRPGGLWRACLDDHETGLPLYVSGRFEEIVPEVLLIFSFRWEGDTHEDGPGVDTLVTVEFVSLTPDQTKIVLTQTGLISIDSVNGHMRGWSSCLDRLNFQLSVPEGSAMAKHRIFATSFASVYPHYVAKAEKKGRSKAEVDQVIRWLTGYGQRGLEKQLQMRTDFETFFAEAPELNPARSLITGVICGVRVEEVEEPTMREIRYLDKLIDELAKGKAMDKILRQA